MRSNGIRGLGQRWALLVLIGFLPNAVVEAQEGLEASAAAQTTDSLGQPENSTWKPRWLSKKEGFRLTIKSMVQLWSIYSTDFEIYNSSTGAYERVDDRFNVSLRRARLAFSGEPYPRLQYTVMLFYDQIGRDVLSSGIGVTNKADPSVGIWDAFFQWKALLKSEALNIVAGWFRPQLQRESITSGWSVNSFEKSMSQSYVRNHLVGTGLGRAAGINIGGLINRDHLGFNYNIGVFTPATTALNGSSSGKKFSPLITGRAVLTIGDPESRQYSISYDINYFNQRKGLSLDFNAAVQGKSDQFESSSTFGPGFLLNYGPLNLDGEWMWMSRSGREELPEQEVRNFTSKTSTGHIRAGVNIPVGRFVLEPIVMMMHFEGAHDAAGQADAAVLKNSSGNETTYEVGINYYLDQKRLKLMLHYTFREGDPGAAGDGATVNQYFSQSGVGAIRRGNWLGLGMNAIF
ncbi:MAG: hypothetical protein HUU01_10120 [Saprospiraceae bacterium]|nr:hypothetical protein [Saprospiraceae bacterium]